MNSFLIAHYLEHIYVPYAIFVVGIGVLEVGYISIGLLRQSERAEKVQCCNRQSVFLVLCKKQEIGSSIIDVSGEIWHFCVFFYIFL